MASRARIVVGFHGTTVEHATAMKNGPLHDPTSVSRWLGRGVYFFEENVELAMKWAIKRAAKTSTDAAVVRANIDLCSCLDLTRSTYQSIVRNAYHFLQAKWKSDASLIPVDQRPFELFMGQVRAGYAGDWQNYGRNNLDFQVIEAAIEIARDQQNLTLDTVRGVFIEDSPLYQNSWLYEGAHVAIAVRSPFARISDLDFFVVS